ncbi:MAG TPA: M28 family metallopeptidase [Acidobacteriota bacterium]|nr:M28 family metallopeptidase [Acidobacteriota bacterium]
MKSPHAVCAGCSLALIGLVIGFASGQGTVERFLGYTQRGTAAEKEIEEKFLLIPSSEETRRLHRYFTSEPHPAGSERNNALARDIADMWKKQGWDDITLHRYDVLVSSPREVSVEMIAPIKYRAGLREDAYDVDPDTKDPHLDPGYLGLSASGDVTAEVVYAHSGNPEDYAVLHRHGIDVRGKIVLVRYSNPYSYRGFKALTAERQGAAAILIYSDPAEDGYARGQVYPDGPWGPESHIQRGSITYDFMVAGDPLTPGWASVPGAKRIPMDQAVSLPKIIAVPLSWRDAKPLLENMDGPEAPHAWRGGLRIKYRLGGKAVRARVKADMDTRLMPNYVVEARIRGSQFPDEWILVGNHRDAWVYGGVDPSSGTASMMELTRALGNLAARGIRPKRTIIACSWDGEEVGLTGSTEWGEQFADDLRKKLVAYINVDSSVSGPDFQASAVASLAPLLVEVSRAVPHPSGRSLYEVWRETAQRAYQAAGGKGAAPAAFLVDTRIGSGSDHTVFLNFLGRPTVGLTFVGPYGVYHSIYDDFYWMNHFGDPDYRRHVMLSEIWGLLALRLSNAEILPFDFAFYAENIRDFVQEVKRKKGVARNVDLKPLLLQVSEFRDAGTRFRQAMDEALAREPIDADILERINRRLMEAEGNWLNPEGIPGRPWFKHLLYAARFTYAHLELPGLTEAVEKGDWRVAGEQARILEKAVSGNAGLLREAAADLMNSDHRSEGPKHESH